MKIFNVRQIRALDAYTIEHEPIASIDLMERASVAFVKWFSTKFPDLDKKIKVFCGSGNNGGDGFAIARLLSQDHYEVTAFQLEIGSAKSPDCQANIDRINKSRCCEIIILQAGDSMPAIDRNTIVIDAIFGSGLSRPLEGYWVELVQYLNEQQTIRVAIDMPSGLFADQPTTGISLYADFTFSFEMPKLAFLFPENDERVGEWSVGGIGLHSSFIEKENTSFYFLEKKDVLPFLKMRKKYSHKGTYGHALLLAGSHGKMGAAVLAARAALRSGLGLLTIHAPNCGYSILQTAVPEAMVLADANNMMITDVRVKPKDYKTIGIGPGMGTNQFTVNTLRRVLASCKSPVVLDADALNILSENKDLLKKLPKDSILTPHPKEFERLFGATKNEFERNELQRKKAAELDCYIILKGAHTAIACPDGKCFFNSTGNPGMATGGSGDVLTGMLTGLLAQGYLPLEAALLGVYLHGLAGDLAKMKMGEEALLAGDIIEHLGPAYSKLNNSITQNYS